MCTNTAESMNKQNNYLRENTEWKCAVLVPKEMSEPELHGVR